MKHYIRASRRCKARDIGMGTMSGPMHATFLTQRTNSDSSERARMGVVAIREKAVEGGAIHELWYEAPDGSEHKLYAVEFKDPEKPKRKSRAKKDAKIKPPGGMGEAGPREPGISLDKEPQSTPVNVLKFGRSA